jgi:Caspase domain
VFDACRNELNLTRQGQKALTEKGFVPMAYTPGVLVAYATAPGRTASDRGTGGGPYAKALSDEIMKPGVDSMLVFSRVARRVQHEIGQDPFLSASTMPEIYFAGNTPPVPSAHSDRSELERAWEFIKETDDPARLEAFIRKFGDTPYAHMARARLEELKKKTAVAAPAPTVGAQPQGTSPPPSVLKEKREHGFDGIWGLRGAGNASCSLKTWRWTDPIQISRSQIVGRNGSAKGQVFGDGTFEITVHSRGVGSFKGKLKGGDGSGTYTWSDTGCSGSFVLHRR